MRVTDYARACLRNVRACRRGISNGIGRNLISLDRASGELGRLYRTCRNLNCRDCVAVYICLLYTSDAADERLSLSSRCSQ